MKDKRRPRLFIYVLALWALSAALRLAIYDPRQNVANLDATYHVLLTVQAYRETPAAVHHFLPLVTLGHAPERGVPWGATVPGANGIYYYTSFPPAGFVAPYLFFQITRLPLTPFGILVFNLLIHLAATLLLALLTRDALRLAGRTDDDAFWLTLGAAATYLFATESLYSHGVIYWHQSLFQVVLIAQLWAFLRILAGERRSALLLALSVIGPSIEWTGYIADAAIASLLFFTRHPEDPERSEGDEGSPVPAEWRPLAMKVLLCAAVAALLFLAHVATVISIPTLLSALRARFVERSVHDASLLALVVGYYRSFSLLPLLALAAAPVVLRARATLTLPRAVAGLLIAATIPLVENLLLLEHASQYAYDRLKALIPICLVLAVACALLDRPARRALATIWIALLAVNVAYRPDRTRDMSAAFAHDGALLRGLSKATKRCTVFAVQSYARGWVDLTVQRNVFESVPDERALRALVESRHACQGVLLAGDAIGNQVYDWTKAVVFDPPDTFRDLVIPSGARNLPSR